MLRDYESDVILEVIIQSKLLTYQRVCDFLRKIIVGLWTMEVELLKLTSFTMDMMIKNCLERGRSKCIATCKKDSLR